MRGGNNRLTLRDVSERFSERGYTLLEQSYSNNAQILRFRCPFHPDAETKISLNRLMKGQGCRYCGYEKMGNGQRIPHDKVAKDFASRNYILLGSYVDSSSKLQYICEKHPDKIASITYSELKQGHGCMLCGRERTATAIKREKHPQWKGGVTGIGVYLRSSLTAWKLSWLEKYNYRCAISGEKGKDLEVHHIVPYSVTRDEVLWQLGLPLLQSVSDYTEDELTAISSLFLKKHESIEGVPLKKQFHIDLHKSFGDSPSLEDFLLFKRIKMEEVSYEQVV